MSAANAHLKEQFWKRPFLPAHAKPLFFGLGPP
jgi:hypothetical protein